MKQRAASTRIIINTAAQYSRSVINIVVSLYSARLILNALGVNDYGIYSLVAGIVTLLSFLSNSLVITTQRFISFHQTKSTQEQLKHVFTNSLFIHIVIAIVVVTILEAIGPFLFDGFLNIAPERIQAASTVYHFVIIMVITTLLMSPFRALLVSHENIVFTSFIEVCASFIKLGIALWLTYHGNEKLILYAALLTIITLFEMAAYMAYDFIHYPECSLPQRKHFDKTIVKSIFGFAGWTLWSQGCTIGRVQGISIVINKFFGTVVNAAYGIGMQVNGAISFVSSSITNAFNPQIMKAAGAGDHSKMIKLASLSCKYSFLLEAAVVVPLFIFCPIILNIWLEQVPDYAIMFCRVILVTSLVDLTTIGLGSVNQALGNIKRYSLYLNSIKLFTIPIIIILLLYGVNLNFAMWTYPAIELFVAILRIPFMKKQTGLNIAQFCRNVFYCIPLPFILCLICYYFEIRYINGPFDIVLSVLVTTIIYFISIYYFALNKDEKLRVNNLLKSIKHNLK